MHIQENLFVSIYTEQQKLVPEWYFFIGLYVCVFICPLRQTYMEDHVVYFPLKRPWNLNMNKVTSVSQSVYLAWNLKKAYRRKMILRKMEGMVDHLQWEASRYSPNYQMHFGFRMKVRVLS